jgi:hypothetical protein
MLPGDYPHHRKITPVTWINNNATKFNQVSQSQYSLKYKASHQYSGLLAEKHPELV